MTRDLMARSFLLGLATGARSSLAVAAPVLFASRATPAAPSRAARVLAALAVGGELVVDKLPVTPSRLHLPGLMGRLVGGGTGAVLLARQHRSGTDPRSTEPLTRGRGAIPTPAPRKLIGPALSGVAGAAAGTWAGAAWRAFAVRHGSRDWPAALVEDAVALAAAVVACRPGQPRADGGSRR